jgi:hypothetical protein
MQKMSRLSDSRKKPSIIEPSDSPIIESMRRKPSYDVYLQLKSKGSSIGRQGNQKGVASP